MKDNMGDRMKIYEKFSESKLLPMLPTFARVDGRSFHSFTKGLVRPFSEEFGRCMKRTALNLAKETNALLTYTQSDEITLMWYSDNIKSQIWFNGKHSKMVSSISSLATLYFYREVCEILPKYKNKLPTFDSRVWQVPTHAEAVNTFLWRELDATKNSISMAARTVYSDKALFGKNSNEKQNMLFLAGINWNYYPTHFKRGTYIKRTKNKRKFTKDELKGLPEKHEARLNPDLEIERSTFETKNVWLSKLENKEAFVFGI